MLHTNVLLCLDAIQSTRMIVVVWRHPPEFPRCRIGDYTQLLKDLAVQTDEGSIVTNAASELRLPPPRADVS